MIRLYYILIILVLSLASAAFAADNKKIAYYIGCTDAEVVADIKYSIEGIIGFARKHDIVIETSSNNGSECGYLLTYTKRRKR